MRRKRKRIRLNSTPESQVCFPARSFPKQTGCGLPAGPGGLVGAIEGVSYLGVAGLLGASAYKKTTTGSGLPAGPFALLGAAEGVAFLLLVAGLYVGVAQVLEYGYIPNAVPVEGGKCA